MATASPAPHDPRVFGLAFDTCTIDEAAQRMLTQRRTAADGVGLFATPNIQHIALARHDERLAEAMAGAQMVVADGFPVYRFVRARGVALPGRVTGREVVERMVANPAALAGHRIYCVVDGEETAGLIRDWAATVPDLACTTRVPPFGFSDDAAYADGLADDIRGFGTTLLFMCIGAPTSEVFVHRHRAQLPPCWALCVGQSFRLILGATAAPPALMVRLNLEWLWRIALEPKRMLRRYGPSAAGFIVAAAKEIPPKTLSRR